MSARDRKATEQATSHRVNWEDLGALDPLFAILSEPGRQFGGWDIDEFLARGVEEVDAVLAAASRHGLPVTRARALECPGRLSLGCRAAMDRGRVESAFRAVPGGQSVTVNSTDPVSPATTRR